MREIAITGKMMLAIAVVLALLGLCGGNASADLIIDNGGPGTSYTGSWKVSGGTTPYGANSLWSRDGTTYTWSFSGQPNGLYDISMWWSGLSSRATNIAVTITHRDGTSTVYINQNINAGQWNSLGQFYLNGSGSVRITAASGSTVSTCADAVKIAPVGGGDPSETIIDNGDSRTSFTGTWSPSGATGFYGINSLWSRDGTTYTWTFTPAESGNYEVSMWWTVYSSRSTTIPVSVEHADGTANLVINQQVGGSLWNSLGTYYFLAGVNYRVIITSQPGPTSTSADAVKFILSEPGANTPPVARDDSAAVNSGSSVVINVLANDTDADGTIDPSTCAVVAGPSHGIAAAEADGTVTYTSDAGYTGSDIFSYNVKDNKGAASNEATVTVTVTPVGGQTTESIFLAAGYATVNARSLMVSTLQDIGAVQQADGSWTFVNSSLNKKFVVRFANSNQTFLTALQTEGAHILYFGHSNYGLGQIFATSSEFSGQTISNLLYIDDDRILTTSSPWISTALHYLRTTSAYPRFWPVFKDGTSGIMPYVFGDPRGNPAYNYYVTYRVPGDPTYYKIMYTDNGVDTAIIRFPDSGKSAWYSSTGATPNPSTQPQYFITNTAAWSPSFLTAGSWTESQGIAGYYKENFAYTAAGQGDKQARWLFRIPKSGDYNVSAWWSSSSAMTSGAPYTVNSASGDTTVQMDQRYNGKKWNSLGIFNFSVGNYSVVLTDDAPSGNVVADAIKVADPNNPADVTQVNFYADRRYGAAPLTVNFSANETGDVSRWSWDFGDGTRNYQIDGGDTVEHVYEKPGTYTVSLTGTGSLGSSTKVKSGYIYVGRTTAPLQAEFRPPSLYARNGTVPLTVTFTDMSTGSIASRLWDFGDGTSSTSRSPSHTYSVPGIYTVSLTVTDSRGNKSTETKQNIIRPIVFEKIIDNVDYPKRHYGSKTVLFRKGLEVPKEQMKYARMVYTGCDSAHNYTDTFGRGIMFYSVTATGEGEIAMSQYLRAYMEGKSDYELWQIMQDVEPVYDYYDFTKTPSQQ